MPGVRLSLYPEMQIQCEAKTTVEPLLMDIPNNGNLPYSGQKLEHRLFAIIFKKILNSRKWTLLYYEQWTTLCASTAVAYTNSQTEDSLV